MTPDDRKFSKTHEWVKQNGNEAAVGITMHAQEALGDITYIELPKPGQIVKKNSECGVIESVKAASDIISPVSGEVVSANDKLTTTPELVNNDPYGEGWLFTVKSLDAAELEELMDRDYYDTFLESEQ